VETVSWEDCTAFFKTVNEKLKGQLMGVQAGFPTEAEWEYACRAGEKGKFCFGDDDKLVDEYCWYEGNSERATHPVAKKKPNAWGLYDLHGNVWEWCADWYKHDYSTQSTADPVGPDDGDGRVCRGGSFDYGPGAAQSPNRERKNPAARVKSLGIRPILR